MSSKAVTDRQKSADAVIAAARTHAGLIADQLSGVVKPYYKKSAPFPDLQTFLCALADVLQTARNDMVTADENHERELADDDEPRNSRDETVLALNDYLVEAREIALGLFGPKPLQKLGFTATVSRDPIVLHRYAGEISSSLRSTTMPTPRVKGAQWNASQVADEIDSYRDKLVSQLESVARENREAQLTLDAKNRAIDAYDSVFSGVASGLCGMLELAGKHELALKVRPSPRKPGQTVDDSEPVATSPAPNPPPKSA
jgi:hypothetical protein